MKTDDRPHLTYHGNLVDELYLRVLGPDNVGGYLAVSDTAYDVALNITRAYLRPIPRDELMLTVFDQHGQRYLPLPPEADVQ